MRPSSYDLTLCFTTHAQSLLVGKKISADGKLARGRTRSLTDCAKKKKQEKSFGEL